MRSVSGHPAASVRDALVLAAGNGDRFKNGSRDSKLLQPVLGQPLILRTLQTAQRAGITHAWLVLGYGAERMREVVEGQAPAGLTLHFLHNADWHLENGVSVLAARNALADRRFGLLMGDHLFDASTLERLRRVSVLPGESVLAVDSRPAAADVVAEATKVQLDGAYIRAIGKELPEHDALDTGLFVCDAALFPALDAAGADGDTTLSGGIRRLAARRAMRALDVGDVPWFDIDTITDLQTAESRLTGAMAEPEPV